MSTLAILKKNWKLPLIALLSLGFALVSVYVRPAPKQHEPRVTPPQAAYHDSVAGIGVIEPSSELMALGTELPGIVRNVYVTVGAQVEANAPLFALDQRDIDAQIAVLERAVQTAQVQLADANAQYAIVQGLEDERAVAKDDYNRRKFAKQLAATRLEEAGAQLAQARVTKARMTVRSPIAGTILEVNVHPGEYASAGAVSPPLMLMGDTRIFHVRVEIDEENAVNVRASSPARAMVRGKPSQSYPLSFVRFEPYVRAKQNLATAGQRVDTRVLRIIYALPPVKNTFFVGQQMDVYIAEQKTPG